MTFRPAGWDHFVPPGGISATLGASPSTPFGTAVLNCVGLKADADLSLCMAVKLINVTFCDKGDWPALLHSLRYMLGLWDTHSAVRRLISASKTEQIIIID